LRRTNLAASNWKVFQKSERNWVANYDKNTLSNCQDNGAAMSGLCSLTFEEAEGKQAGQTHMHTYTLCG